MTQATVESIVRELSAQGADVQSLLQKYQHESYEDLWRRDVRLYRAFAQRLISADRPLQAFDLAREGLLNHKSDLELMYLEALALERGGNRTETSKYAEELADAVEASLRVAVDALALAGKISKRRFERAADPVQRRELAGQAAREYERAHRMSDKSFPTINAATMSLLAGQVETARSLALEAIRRAEIERKQQGRANDYWILATLGEASLIRGDVSRAEDFYRDAVRFAEGNVGDIASMRRNVRMLKHAIEVPRRIEGIFNIGTLVVFAGHMVDHPTRVSVQRQRPRFPDLPRMEIAVREAIAEKLAALNATVGYSSAACGSDILFAEEILKRRGQMHVVLPFDRDDFYSESVDFGYDAMAAWRVRCEELIGRDGVGGRATLHWATTERYLGDAILFEFVNTFCQGLAISHAARLGIEAVALVVLEPAAKKLTGGTAYFVDQWKSDERRRCEEIDLASLRSRAFPSAVPQFATRDLGSPQRSSLRLGADISRKNKVMLFADVKGFSQLSEEDAPACFIQLIDVVHDVMQHAKQRPKFHNTWGDGLFMVFDDEQVAAAAEFAITLSDRVRDMTWQTLERPIEIKLRIGIHAGPVFPRHDPMLGKENYFGRHVNLAARIEPVTEPGSVYTSEQFAALLTVKPDHGFVCEYVGIAKLPKNSGELPLYRLRRK